MTKRLVNILGGVALGASLIANSVGNTYAFDEKENLQLPQTTQLPTPQVSMVTKYDGDQINNERLVIDIYGVPNSKPQYDQPLFKVKEGRFGWDKNEDPDFQGGNVLTIKGDFFFGTKEAFGGFFNSDNKK